MHFSGGDCVTFFILPAISRFNVPYEPSVVHISLRRSRRMIQTTFSRYGLLSLDMAGDMKIAM